MKKIIWLQLAAALLTLAPLAFLSRAAFAGNSDGLFYAIVLKLVAAHMAQGDWWPRWLDEANGGLGSPVMQFYSPLAYQLTAFFTAPLAPFDPLGWKRLALGMVLAQWLGGIAAWVWLKRHGSPRAALIASLLFTLFPYKWIYIYLHANLAQLWALAFLPPLMMAAEDISDGKRRATAWYALWLALLALTHPRTLVAFAAVPALYALIFARGGKIRALLSLFIAHAWAFLLAAFYLLPALLNLDLVQSALANAGRFSYAENLSHRDVLYNLHYAVIAVLVIGLRLRLPTLRATLSEKEMRFWLGALLIVILLCLRLSQPLWDRLPMLQFLQFPAARLHAVALMAACLLAVLFLDWPSKAAKRLPSFYSPAALYIVVLAMTAVVLGHVRAIYAEGGTLDWTYVEKIHALNPILPPEYLTRWQPANANGFDAITAEATLPAVAFVSGQGTASMHHLGQSAGIDASISSDTALLRLHQLYWPGFRPTSVQVAPDRQGLLTLRLPHGDYHITLHPTPLPGQSAGTVLSLLAWLGWLAFLFAARRRAA